MLFFQRLDILERERETISETLRTHYDKKLAHMTSLESELEAKKNEFSEMEENLKSAKKTELELMQQIKKHELTIQKMRLA